MDQIALRTALTNFLGHTLDTTKATEHVRIVTGYVRAYTRGEGFDASGNPNDELSAVIVTAAARSLASPSQVVRKEVGGLALLFSPFTGFTLAERLVLNRYRQRTA